MKPQDRIEQTSREQGFRVQGLFHRRVASKGVGAGFEQQAAAEYGLPVGLCPLRQTVGTHQHLRVAHDLNLYSNQDLKLLNPEA